MLKRVATTDLLATKTQSLTDALVTGDATVYVINQTVCIFGQAQRLEPDLLSFLEGGSDCTKKNGCGVHVHAGLDCFNLTTQQGHLYNQVTVPTDPWAQTQYRSTDSNGLGYFTACVETGAPSLVSRAFIVHANNGDRVSCGLLDLVAPDPPTATPSAAPSTSITPTLNVVAAPAASSSSPVSAPQVGSGSPVTAPVPNPVPAPVRSPVAAPPVRSPVAAPVAAPKPTTPASAAATARSSMTVAFVAFLAVAAVW